MTRAAIVCASLFLGLVAAGGGASTRVKPTQKIQDAIDAAKPGDSIIVEAGTYSEYLTISKNGIDLQARSGVILQPPSSAAPDNTCNGLAGPGTSAGICITGTNVVLNPYPGREHRKFNSTSSYVEGVRVKGFDIRAFPGLNIAIVAAKDAEVRENTVSDAPAYGILTVGSHGSLITRNKVKTSNLLFIGICMDDQSDVTVTQNEVSEYGIALCVQTNKADVGHNKVTNCCIGAFVDPGVDGARITHNTIGPSNPLCGQKDYGGFASGVVLGGATNAEVHRNDIKGQTDSGSENTAAGVLIYDIPETGPVATGNKVTFNDLKGSDTDIAVFSAGNNEISHNGCVTSIPDGLCSK